MGSQAGGHGLHEAAGKPLFVVPPASESKASVILSFLAGDQPRRGPPRAERLPQEARLCPGHLRRLPGGGHGDPRQQAPPGSCCVGGALADAPPLPDPRQVCLKYYEYEFMELACQCPAVVCCRCAPTQKAQIVRLLQERTGKLTCAVGRAAAAAQSNLPQG